MQGHEGVMTLASPGLTPGAREARLQDVDGNRERDQPGDAGVFLCDFEFHRQKLLSPVGSPARCFLARPVERLVGHIAREISDRHTASDG